MQGSTCIVRKQTKYQTQCHFLREIKEPYHIWSFTSRRKVNSRSYYLLPLFSVFRATTGQITTLPLKVRIKLSQNCEALWVGMCGRWEFQAVCLFGEMDVCRCFANVSLNILIVVYIRSCKLLFDAQSSVCSGNVVLLSAHTHADTHLRTSERAEQHVFSLSVSFLFTSIGGVGAINQAVWERAE